MRVVIAGDYPEDPPTVVGGIQAVIYNTIESLATYGDLDLHIVTCEKWRSRPQKGPHTLRTGQWTVHYLPSSPQIPHTVSMLTVDRWAIRRQIETLTPDLIHAHGQAAAYPFAAFDTRRRTVVTVHGINMLEAQVDAWGGRAKGAVRTALWTHTERRCLRRASDLVAISPFAQAMISPHTQARQHLIENPVHRTFFELERAPIPGKVLMTGTIRKLKGTLEAIQAMSLVRRHMPHAELYIAGGFTRPFREYGDLVRKRISEWQAGDYVHIMGYLDHQGLLDAYRTSQVFLLPSWLESSPVALGQAMACGLPSVVSDIGGTAHLIEDGDSGYRVPVRDVEALADRIIYLLQDEVTGKRLGHRARQAAQERFTQEVAAQKTHDLYYALT